MNTLEKHQNSERDSLALFLFFSYKEVGLPTAVCSMYIAVCVGIVTGKAASLVIS
jgi:hypothetical protein